MDKAWDEEFKQRLAEIDRTNEKIQSALAKWRLEIHGDNAAWEAEVSQQILQGPEKAEFSGIVLDTPIPKE